MDRLRESLDAGVLRAALSLRAFDGREGQRPMEPALRGKRPAGIDATPPRSAAALAYVFPRRGMLQLPITLRHPDMPEHRGQVSLPGGRPRAGEDLWTTALREAHEEIGLAPDEPERLGMLSTVHIPVTHTDLHVCVALGADPGPLQPDGREVVRLEIVPLADLLDPARRRPTERRVGGRSIEAPCFDLAGLEVWGATAMALSELAERLREALRLA